MDILIDPPARERETAVEIQPCHTAESHLCACERRTKLRSEVDQKLAAQARKYLEENGIPFEAETKEDGPDAGLLSLVEQYDILTQARYTLNEKGADDDRFLPLVEDMMDRQEIIAEKMLDYTPTTLDGFKALAGAIYREADMGGGELMDAGHFNSEMVNILIRALSA